MNLWKVQRILRTPLQGTGESENGSRMMKTKGISGINFLLSPLVGAILLWGSSVPTARAGDEAATDSSHEAERRRILERIRCQDVVAEKCYIPEDADAQDDPPPLYYDAEGRPVTSAQVDAEFLLNEMRTQLERHEENRVVQAGAELEDERFSELRFFGVTDHYLDPPIDFYKDPVKSISRQPMLFLDQIRPEDFDIPIVVNERVQDWMVYFLTTGRKYYVRWLGRSTRYESMVMAKLTQAGMPRALFYQAMIESGFSPYAYSYAKAAGMWQFIAETGRRYGMQVDWWVDERRDPEMATDGAIGYMAFLHKRFGDWYLAAAAYNSGEGKIDRAIQRYGTRDFWEMSKGDYLRQETKDYVPKMLAAAILGKYADRYGLTKDVQEWNKAEEADVVQVPEATDVGIIARSAGTTEEVILEMNPALRRWCTPPEVDSYPIRIPAGTAERFAAEFAKIPPEERLTFKRYKVKRGDSVTRIARIYGVSSEAIRRMNGLKSDKGVKSGTYLVIPVRAQKEGEARTVVHDVKRGESLGIIATRYGVGVDQLREWNDLKSDVIVVNQRLVLQLGSQGVTADAFGEGDEESKPVAAVASTPGEEISLKSAQALATKAEGGASEESTEKASKPSSSPSKGKKITHVVASGDALGTIAQKYGVTIDELKKWNKIKGTTIMKGQKLQVWLSGDAARKVNYTVASGDTLWEVANKFGVSVNDVRQWNKMASGDSLHAGARLVLYTTAAEQTVAKASSSKSSSSTKKAKTVVHKVAAGDTLGSIAQKYSVSVSDLKVWNGLRRTTIYVGQKLTLKLSK